MDEPGARQDDKDAVVDAAARTTALDRYLAARLAPRQARRDLIALAAFAGETARIVATASEPLVGEMRLQWWRNVLEPRRAAGEATGNPVADALREAIARHALPVELFAKVLDARSRALEPDFGKNFAKTGPALEEYLDETEGTAFRLAARILGVTAGEAVEKLMFAAGQAYGRVQFLRSIPLMSATGRRASSQGALVNDWAALAPRTLEAAQSWLQQARRDARRAPAAIPAVLPVALVEPYLAALERLGPDIVRTRADISPLTRVWRLWWSSVRGKI